MKGILQHWPAVVFVRHSTSVADVVYRDDRDGGHNKKYSVSSTIYKVQKKRLNHTIISYLFEKKKRGGNVSLVEKMAQGICHVQGRLG